MNLPVLLLAYNRPRQTLKILNFLVNQNIKNIFISLDGPKKNIIDKEKSKNLIKDIKLIKKKKILR